MTTRTLADAAVLSVSIDWRACSERVPPPMETVLVAGAEALEPTLGYWDGDCWYSTSGEPIDGAGWWSPLPYTPAGRVALQIATR